MAATFMRARIGEHFGVEAGYFRTREEDKNIAVGTIVGPGPTVAAADFSTKVQLHGFTLDALVYLPLDAARRFELIGTAGISYTKAEADFEGLGRVDDSEFGFRAGAGAQYALSPRLNARAIARYQSADFDGIVDRAWIYTAGMNYNF